MFTDDRISNECNLWRHLPIGAASRRRTLLYASWLYGRWRQTLHYLLTRSCASISVIDLNLLAPFFTNFPWRNSPPRASFLKVTASYVQVPIFLARFTLRDPLCPSCAFLMALSAELPYLHTF